MKRAAALARVSILLLVLSAIVTSAPSAAAHHPGSVLGLARYVDAPLLGDNVVHRNPDVDATFARWDSEFPDFVERVADIGSTTAGFPLYSVKVTDESVAFDGADVSTGHKLRVYLDGGHHGNEYMGVELVMYYLEDLLAKAAAGDEDALRFLRETEVYATPIVNVEGNFLDTRKNGRQVDLNRNYPFEWGGPGSDSSVSGFTYRGPEPASESEVKANIAFAEVISPDVWVTMHTGIAEFYWPWGWTHDPSPDDAFFTSLEEPFEAATNGRVDAMQAAELYLAAGATDDYGYGALGVPTFTFEVHEDQFIPVYGRPIPQEIADQLAGLDFIVKNVRHIGAWVEPLTTDDGLLLENLGWGDARNVTVTFNGGRTAVVDVLPVGGSVLLPASLLEQDGVTYSYPILHIDTSRVRTHEAGLVHITEASADANGIPGAGLALALAVVALAAVGARRRLR